jgi:hypothetical protein
MPKPLLLLQCSFSSARRLSYPQPMIGYCPLHFFDQKVNPHGWLKFWWRVRRSMLLATDGCIIRSVALHSGLYALISIWVRMIYFFLSKFPKHLYWFLCCLGKSLVPVRLALLSEAVCVPYNQVMLDMAMDN